MSESPLNTALGTLDDRLGELEHLLAGPAPEPQISRPAAPPTAPSPAQDAPPEPQAGSQPPEPPGATPFPSVRERLPAHHPPPPIPDSLTAEEIARSLSAPVIAALERLISEQQVELQRMRADHDARIDALTREVASHAERALGRLGEVASAREHLEALIAALQDARRPS